MVTLRLLKPFQDKTVGAIFITSREQAAILVSRGMATENTERKPLSDPVEVKQESEVEGSENKILKSKNVIRK